MEHLTDDACPFCGDSTAGNLLVEAYRGYFSDAYAAHKADLDDLLRQTEIAFGPAAGLRTAQAFKDNGQTGEFLSAYTKHGYSTPAAADRITTEMEALRVAAVSMLVAKIAAPLDMIPLSDSFVAATGAWATTTKELAAANGAMTAANVAIQAVKDANAKTDKNIAQAALAKLQAIKNRHSEPFATLATGYNALVDEKDAAVSEKDAKKNELDTYDAAILGAYQADINKFLERFNAGFKLSQECRVLGYFLVARDVRS